MESDTYRQIVDGASAAIVVADVSGTIRYWNAGAEALFGLCLMIGWRTRSAALMSGILLILFGVTMTGALGVKAPLDFSVFSAAGGAFLLATCTEFPFSVDKLRRSR